MSSVEAYFPEGLSVVMEGDSSFSKSLGILIRLDRNVALFNPYLDSIHNKSIYNARDLTRYSHRKGLVLRASISYLIPVTPEQPEPMGPAKGGRGQERTSPFQTYDLQIP